MKKLLLFLIGILAGFATLLIYGWFQFVLEPDYLPHYETTT